MRTYGDQNSVESSLALRVVELNPGTDARWETFVKSSAQGLIYHHPAWLQVLEETYGHKPVHLASVDDRDQVQGVLPLFYTRGLLSGRLFSSLPRTPVGGPLASDEQTLASLLHAAIERTCEMPGAQIQIKMLTNKLDGLVDGLYGVPWRKTYRLELPWQPELLHFGNSRNHAQIKRAVNKATKQGVEVCQAETESELRAWYELYLDNMRWVVVPPRPYHFFESAWRKLQPAGMLRLLLARQYTAGVPRLVGGILLLMFGQTVFYAFSGWQREEKALRPNYVLHWRAIHDACAEGFRYYDFGEVPKNNKGLAEFKSKWGTEASWMYRYYYPVPRELGTSMLESDSRMYQLAALLWQRLPIKAIILLSNLAHRLF